MLLRPRAAPGLARPPALRRLSNYTQRSTPLSSTAIGLGLVAFVASVFFYTMRQVKGIDDLGPEFNEKQKK